MSYLSHSLRGEELVLDSGTLWRAARAINDALAGQGHITDLSMLSAEILQHPALALLKEHELLRNKLIETVEAEQKLLIVHAELTQLPWYRRGRRKELRAQMQPLIAARDSLWREYEMLRKLSVRDGNRSLMLHRNFVS